MANLKRIKYLNEAAYADIRQSAIPTIKRHHYFVIPDLSVTGDQPKEIIRVYEYGRAHKSSRKNWTLYIAKSAEKWYPNETIIEHLLNRIGDCFGLHMAFSRLAVINGQIRFLSRYFLKGDEELIHGADIYAGHINDRDFVETIEKQKRARDFFTLQFTYEAIQSIFPDDVDTIVEELVRMLIFDALVGNNDRHFYNWAVIRDLGGKKRPSFSPIYDTARGFFWNEEEEKVVNLWHDNKNTDVFLKKYIKNSRPKIGWDGETNLNHFKLVELIVRHHWGIDKKLIKEMLSSEKLNHCFQMIDDEFSKILSPERINLTKKCLEMRYTELLNIVKNN